MAIHLPGLDQIRIFHTEHGTVSNDDESLREAHSEGILQRFINQIKEFFLYKKVYHLTLTHYILLITWFNLFFIYMRFYYPEKYSRGKLHASIILNTLLFSCSDILAQSISYYYSENIDPIPDVFENTANLLTNSVHDSLFVGTHDNNIETGYESDNYSVFNEYGIEPEEPREDSPIEIETVIKPTRARFNFYRWLVFMCWADIITWFQVPWYKTLNFFFTSDPSVVQIFERVLADQLMYAPLSLFLFFTYTHYAVERGNTETFKAKIEKIYISTLGCNYLLWPIVQLINFSVVPKRFQIPFSSSVGVLWNCFLSMRSASSSR